MRYASHLRHLALFAAVLFVPLNAYAKTAGNIPTREAESAQLFRKARNTFTLAESRLDSRLAQRSRSLLLRGRIKLSKEILRNNEISQQNLKGLEQFAKTTIHLRRSRDLTTFFENSLLGDEQVLGEARYKPFLRLVALAYAAKG